MTNGATNVVSLLPSLVDELADLNQKAAVLEARIKTVKEQLIASGQHEVCGLYHRAVIVEQAAGETTDYKAAAEANLTPAVIAGYKKPRAGSTQVRLHGYTAG